jgi:hypothetical protein
MIYRTMHNLGRNLSVFNGTVTARKSLNVINGTITTMEAASVLPTEPFTFIDEGSV